MFRLSILRLLNRGHAHEAVTSLFAPFSMVGMNDVEMPGRGGHALEDVESLPLQPFSVLVMNEVEGIISWRRACT